MGQSEIRLERHFFFFKAATFLSHISDAVEESLYSTNTILFVPEG